VQAISIRRDGPADPAWLEVTTALAAELPAMYGSAEHER